MTPESADTVSQEQQETMSILDCVQATMTNDEFAVFCLELLKIADVDLNTVGIF